MQIKIFSVEMGMAGSTSILNDSIEEKKKELMARVESCDFNDLLTGVAFILKNFPETRTSYVRFFFRYWMTFQLDLMRPDGFINEEMMERLESFATLERAKRKIQNTYGLFRSEKD